jgi:phosphatidylglycerophosphatase A
MTTSIPEADDMSNTQPVPFQPDLNLIYSHPAYLIAFVGGIGLIPFAPGTMGTLAAFPLFWLFNHYLSPVLFLLLIDIMFIAGIWACGLSGKALGSPDHGGMVWDETVAFLLVLYFTPVDWVWQLVAFILFRLFDIAKPQPIRYYDSHLQGGFGVMLDDILAAFFTLLCLAGWKAWVLVEGY